MRIGPTPSRGYESGLRIEISPHLLGERLVDLGIGWGVENLVLLQLCFAQFSFQTTTLCNRKYNIAKLLMT